ncbi:hypothetical protein Fleli_2940 [Bernardetia litoralis DSM 6794]|uniref:DUF4221 domain-containing protein n=1 Tax=Bernardetia litoralis (strain ATCC 23117 / DSM 6794 / NBRC 15988 / NCIMB 1366 / Fx l1 / Sio-4) TaxID=880071 RepID=I4AMV2_BERLS|nr:hypothetical protein [Bernardetia litoralis]AFM05287.1 hypothetical protein Fleli_2940 [Bernardetia litoralis DSM 6794]
MKNYLFLFVVLLLFSCTQNKKPNNELNTNISKNETLSIIKAISIPIDTLPYNFEYTSIHKEDNELYFVGLDKPTNALYFYSITNQSFSHKIQKPTEGSEKFMIKQFYIHSKDSIFLLDDYGTKLQIVNIRGNNVCSFKFKNKQKTNIVEASLGKGIIYFGRDNKIVLPSYVEIEDTKAEFYKYGFGSLFLLKNDSLSLINDIGKFPDEYTPDKSSYFYYPSANMIKYNDNILLSFSKNHNLFSLNVDKNKTSKLKKWKSSYLEEDFERLQLNHDIQQGSNYVFTTGFYTLLKIDTETEILYRIVKHPQPLKNTEGKLNQYLECGFSIMYGKIDDPNPKEVLLEKGKYVPYVVHSIGNNQLLISLENPFNPNNKENMLEFEIIELK